VIPPGTLAVFPRSIAGSFLAFFFVPHHTFHPLWLCMNLLFGRQNVTHYSLSRRELPPASSVPPTGAVFSRGNRSYFGTLELPALFVRRGNAYQACHRFPFLFFNSPTSGPAAPRFALSVPRSVFSVRFTVPGPWFASFKPTLPPLFALHFLTLGHWAASLVVINFSESPSLHLSAVSSFLLIFFSASPCAL